MFCWLSDLKLLMLWHWLCACPYRKPYPAGGMPRVGRLCVPKPHPLMSCRNRLIWRNDLIGSLCPGHPHFAVQVSNSARGGECGASTAVDCSAAQGEGTGQADERRPLVLCAAIWPWHINRR